MDLGKRIMWDERRESEHESFLTRLRRRRIPSYVGIGSTALATSSGEAIAADGDEPSEATERVVRGINELGDTIVVVVPIGDEAACLRRQQEMSEQANGMFQ